MKKNILKICVLAAVVGFSSCTKDLDRMPTNSTTSDIAYGTLAGYKQVLAKVYGSFALAGNNGTSTSDLAGIDPGQADFLRLYWNAQELPTEEAMCVWNDPGIPDFHYMNWTSNNVLLAALYNRALFHVTVANEFLREATDGKIASRGFSGKDAEEIKTYRAEARFLRAFEYWVLMDLFANPPFVTENDPIGKYIPPQTTRAELFKYVESELLAIEPLVVTARNNEYARADQAAVWSLLARLYLNAEVYLGKGNGKYTEAITYSSKVINAGYALKTDYKGLFLADNNTANPEVILPIVYDGVNMQNNGGTTFIINAAINGDMNPASFGVPGGGWGGNRSTSALPGLFADQTGATDKRAMFFGDKAEISDVSQFAEGLRVIKYRNVTSTGVTPPAPGGAFSSVDFPLFRLAEQYLIYAEAVKRGGSGGSETSAITYLNALRERAYGNTSGNISSYNLDYVLEERGRELYWEAFRRTDLIRYEKFTGGSYVWPWKGGVKEGRGVESFRTVYPLPATDLTANPSLKQNTGY
ncbi:RagB/SusD family nutrient uptake outer membrane protein [Chitinophaga sp. sic0106]|uniref:RagB/SusD family nutrient uptake outer membrane protein n=1 Tax=Chitinophaga sp. sic0106 TaxID=2854785 RepID=UPI001C451A11|nr:RagB/SusD family nutrient uptake outer membrane protein [Chitinophaga sp. sic0106]MBV7530330.1 RagB/SusD family nutrient uptake outer membrane protein [Chitinophaga sp. sic0106]